MGRTIDIDIILPRRRTGDTFEETKHHRNHGQFSSGGGNATGPVGPLKKGSDADAAKAHRAAAAAHEAGHSSALAKSQAAGLSSMKTTSSSKAIGAGVKAASSALRGNSGVAALHREAAEHNEAQASGAKKPTSGGGHAIHGSTLIAAIHAHAKKTGKSSSFKAEHNMKTIDF